MEVLRAFFAELRTSIAVKKIRVEPLGYELAASVLHGD
jgi:hypothetical protein